MGNPSSQLNQQQQEQNYLSNVRQQLNNQFNQPQFNQQPMMFNQRPMQQMMPNQQVQSQTGSLATMDPSTYQNFQAFQQHRIILTNNKINSKICPNASIATMGPETFQNSPFTQGGYYMGSPSPQMNQQQQEQIISPMFANN